VSALISFFFYSCILLIILFEAFDINTTLYPHQKKAVTFLLEREGEVSGPARDPNSDKPQPLPSLWENGTSSSASLWQVRPGINRKTVWVHAVTDKQVEVEPKVCKAALLADDVSTTSAHAE